MARGVEPFQFLRGLACGGRLRDGVAVLTFCLARRLGDLEAGVRRLASLALLFVDRGEPPIRRVGGHCPVLRAREFTVERGRRVVLAVGFPRLRERKLGAGCYLSVAVSGQSL